MTSTDAAGNSHGVNESKTGHMEWERIRKHPDACAGVNLVDYDEYAKTFSWTQARALLAGLPGGGLNIAYEAVERHVKAGRGDKLALRWIGRDDAIRDFSYATLGTAVNRFANVLAQHGITKGDRVSSLLGRVPELYIGALGTLKNGSVQALYLDASSSLEIKGESMRRVQGAQIETEQRIGDYRNVEGLWIPHSFENGPKGRPEKQKITIEKVELNVPLDDARFTMPAVSR